MRKELIGAASAFLFATGAAIAGEPDTAASQTRTAPPAAAKASAASASAEELMGKQVVGADNEDLGKVKDVVIEPATGKAKQLILSSGGFLGIGEKMVAVDFNDADFRPGDKKVTIANLSREQIQTMREFNYDDTMVSLGRSSDMDRTSIDSSTRDRDRDTPNANRSARE